MKHVMMVMTNAVAGRDDEYNDWYDNRHLSDVLRVPGFVGAKRYELSPHQRIKGAPPYHYLAIYELDTDDLKGSIEELGRRSGTDEMPMSDALAVERLTLVFQPRAKK